MDDCSAIVGKYMKGENKETFKSEIGIVNGKKGYICKACMHTYMHETELQTMYISAEIRHAGISKCGRLDIGVEIPGFGSSFTRQFLHSKNNRGLTF